MVWQRARSPEQKEHRRAEILAAAAALFERGGLEAASLNAIAREAGISKANIYRYFESREAIFLHMVLEDYASWTSTVEQAMAPLAGGDDEEAVVTALVSTLLERPRLCSLASSLATVLEHNITVDVVVWFKTEMLAVGLRLTNAIGMAMPSLDVEQVYRFLLTAQMLLAGIWPSANPPEAVREALQRPELAQACVDFERDFEQALVTHLRGLKGRPPG